MRKLILLFFTTIILSNLNAQQTMYWVNGTGNWNDPSHWSTVSGGEAGISVPDKNTKVIFDENSFTEINNHVLLKGDIKCDNFIVLSSLFTLKGKGSISIFGSIDLNNNVSLQKFKGNFIFSSSENCSINMPNDLNSEIYFNGSGSWDFNSNISTNKNIYFKQGHINTNGYNIHCNDFIASGDQQRKLNLGSSQVNVSTWNFENSKNLDFDAGDSEIIIARKIEKNISTGNLKYNIIKPAGAKALSATITPTDASCPKNVATGTIDDGEIFVEVSGGDGTYVIQLRDGGLNLLEQVTGVASTTFVDLESGLYNISYGEDVLSLQTESVSVGPDNFIVTINVHQDVSCYNGSDLQLIANSTGGSGVYTDYLWTRQSEPGWIETTQIVTGIGPQNYQVVVTDDNGCTKNDGFLYLNGHPQNDYTTGPTDVSISNVSATATCQGASTGEITVGTVTGGTPNLATYPTTGYGYAVRIDGSGAPLVYADGNTISNLVGGDYEVWVIDDNGCEKQHASIMTVAETPAPTATILSDGTVCEGDNYTVSVGQAVATNYSSINWLAVPPAAGSFTGGNTQTPTYIQDAGDIGNSPITLRMVVNGNGTCTAVSDDLILTINPVPVPNAGSDDTNCGLVYNLDGTQDIGGSTITWSKVSGPGNVSFDDSSLEDPEVTVTLAGVYVLQMQEDALGCIGTSTVQITFVDAPTADAGSDDAICANETYTLSSATATNYASLSWINSTTGDGTGFDDPASLNPVYTPSPADIAAGTVDLTLTAGGNVPCPDAISTITLTINPVPVPDAGADDSNCGSTYTGINASRDIGGSALTWSKVSGPGNVTFIPNENTEDPNINVDQYGVYVFQLEENASGCIGTSTVEVTFVEPPSANAGPNDQACSGDTYTLSSATASGYTSLAWTNSTTGDGTGFDDPTSLNPVYTPSPADIAAGTVTLTLTATGNAPCTTSGSSMVLTINPIPVPDAGADDTNCGNNYLLNGTRDIGGSTLSWTKVSGPGTAVFNDSNLEDPSVTVSLYGVYVFQLEETIGGCSGTSTVEITFNDVASAFAGNDASVCDGDTYTLSGATASNYASLSWINSTTGDGTGFDDPALLNPVYTPSPADIAAGTVTLTLTAVGNVPCPNANDAMVLTINPIPVPDAGVDDNTCGLVYNLNATRDIGGSALTWTKVSGPGNVAFDNANIEDAEVTVDVYGVYVLQLEEIANSCTGTTTVEITFTEGATANAGSDDAICDGDTYTLSGATASNYASLSWINSTTGDGTGFDDPASLNPVYTPSPADIAAGTVDLTLTATGNVPCPNVPSTMTLTINPLPVPGVVGDNNVCLNDIETYTTEAGMSGYSWNVVGGNIVGPSTGNSIQVEWTALGGQSVSVNYTNGNSCTGAAPTSLAVTVNDLPAPDLSVNVNTTCINQDLGLVGNPSGGSGVYTSHTWTGTGAAFLDDANIQNPTFNCPTPGSYDLTYTVIDDNGCEGSDNMTVTVLDGPTVYAGVDSTICYDGDYTVLDATATNYTGLSWINSTTGDGTGFDDDTALNPTYTPSPADRAAGSVTLTLTASSALCGDVLDDMVLTFAPELVASIGAPTPFLIDNATTQIKVMVWATHNFVNDLGVYLVAPDGLTKIRLYDHQTDGGGFCFANSTIDSLVFDNTSVSNLDFCNFPATPITGTFASAETFATFNGMDPAQGGWSLEIEDVWPGNTGTLTRARISFTDINGQGNPQTIAYDSETIAEPILDNSTTTYYVPIGLRTSCFGACDARAIVSVTGGTPPYVSYVWDDVSIPSKDTVDLCGGDYQVTVTDSKGCTSVAIVSVLEPDPVVLAFDSTNVACFGDSTGMVTVSASDGEPPYTYLWNDGNNTTNDTVFNLPAGTYTVTVTDLNTCSTIGSVSITQPVTPVTVANITIDSTDCNASNGTVTITPAGGTPYTVGDAYTYLWDHDGSTDNPKAGLGVGNYLVTIFDSLGCSIDTTITMIDKGDLVVTGFTMLNEVSCNGTCDGEVQVDFTGGSGNYTYVWSGGGLNGTNQSLPNVCGDSTYTVIITDVNTTCSTTDFHTITQPDSLKMTVLNQTDVLCNGDSTGTAEVTGIDGTGAYTYVWYTATNDTLSEISTANKLPYGYVYIDVRDANLCLHTDSIFIDEPTSLTATKDSTETGCGLGTGEAVITPAGGTPFPGSSPYTYLWNDPAGTTDSIATGLEVGIYNVTVTDANGCQLIESVTIIDNSTLTVVLDSIENVRCAGDHNGKAYITVSNGDGPYDFDWSSGETIEDAIALEAGSNFVTVTDNRLCSRVLEVILTEPDTLKTFTAIENEPLCFESPTGSASVTPSGGIEPYTYEWADGQTDSTAINLLAGKHFVTVTDFNGCIAIDSITLTDPLPITFDFEFIETDCGDSIGVINVANIAGGTGPYTTDWASPEWSNYPAADSIGTDTIRNLWVGNYVAIVSDFNGCIVRDSMNLRDVSNMDIQVDSMSMVSCFGGNDGAIIALGINGSAPYSYEWSNGDTDSLLNGAVAGTYMLTVIDDGLCRRDTAFTITEPNEIINEWVFTQPIVCNGDDTASFYANITGGVEPYTYFWENSLGENMGADSNLNDVGVDWYYLTVVDDNSCVFEDSIEIFEPTTIDLTITQGETSCPDSVGWAKVTVTGGVSPYDYNWYLLSDELQPLDGQITDSAFNLWVDVFVIEVTDSLGCVAYDTVTIEDDSGLDFTIQIGSLPTCTEIANGKAWVSTVIGGTLPYNYFWDNAAAETTDTAFALPVGITNVYVTDNLGCRKAKYVEMSADSVLAVSIESLNDISLGLDDCNGYAKANVTGGIKPYTFVWSKDGDPTPIGTDETITGLCEGWYYVTITDDAPTPACEIIDSVFIANDPLTYDTLLLQHVLCNSDSTGAITIQARGGYPGGYAYAWAFEGWSSYPDADSTGSSISNLVAGKYYVTISDLGGSEINDSIVVAQPDQYIPFYAITETNCFDSSGVVLVNESLSVGGTAPFIYEWANENWASYPSADSTGVSLSDLWVDEFYVTITDANNCIIIDTVEMTDNSDFEINPDVHQPIRCNGFNNGIIFSAPDLGMEDYIYSWSNGQTTDTISDLTADTYYVTVTDAEGCIRSDSVVLEEPAPLTFEFADTVLNNCYSDCQGSITIDNVLGGNSATGDIDYILRDITGILYDGTNNVITGLCVQDDYTIQVRDDRGCVNIPVPLVTYSVSPQPVATFEIIDTASCNFYSDNGTMAVEIKAGYFDQVSPTLNLSFDLIQYEWDGNPTFKNDTLENALAGLHTVLVRTTKGVVTCEEPISYSMPYLNYSYMDSAYVVSTGLFEDYFCAGDTVELYAESTGADSIVWDNKDYIVGGETSALLVKSAANSTLIFYPTAYTNGCRDIDTLVLGRYSIDTLYATIEDDKEKVFVGNEIQLQANKPDVEYAAFENFDVEHKFTWTADNDFVSWVPVVPDIADPIARPSETTLFTVYDSIIITNNTYSNQICVLTDTVSIEVLPEFDPPSGFTPNADGINDLWRLPALTGNENATVQIFNRWGGLVWEQSGNYKGREWDGTNLKGKPLPSGTYYYRIEYADDDKTKEITGPITILR